MRRKLEDNLQSVENRIGKACARANRDRDDVHLVAVTKSVSPDVICELVEMGVSDFGENRVQELTQRASFISDRINRHLLDTNHGKPAKPTWHMIGALQRNKVKPLLPWVDMIQSVDRLRLAEEIHKRAEQVSRCVDVLLEVNGGDEAQKSGVAVCAASHLGEQIASLDGLRLRGLMTMAPIDADEEALRRIFTRVRELYDEIRKDFNVGDAFDTLSMGMSGDFEIAVECGATMVRVGSALFEGIDSHVVQPVTDNA